MESTFFTGAFGSVGPGKSSSVNLRTGRPRSANMSENTDVAGVLSIRPSVPRGLTMRVCGAAGAIKPSLPVEEEEKTDVA